MRQALHLLIVDAARGGALLTWHGSRWLMPIVQLPERVRPERPVLQWLKEHSLAGEIAGLWLGRADPNAAVVEWLCVVDAAADASSCPMDLRWTLLSSLISSRSWVEYQEWAALTALSKSDLPAVGGPFGTMAWRREVREWILETIGSHGPGTIETVVPYRVSAYDVVLEVQTTHGLLYFKGLSAERASEPRLALLLGEIAPESFARTLAVRSGSDGAVWWLVEACPGSTLASHPTLARSMLVIDAFAHLQKRLARLANHVDTLTTLDLPSLAAWARELLDDIGDREAARDSAEAIDMACEHVATGDVPWAWILADLDPTNVLIDGGGVRFIDLEDCSIGPAPIAAATLARRLKRYGLACDGTLYAAYERAWSTPLNANGNRHAFEIISRVLECRLGWRRVVTKSDRGEVRGILQLARERLASRLCQLKR